jgi:hypothetical protein
VKHGQLYRIAAEFILLCVCVFLLLSVVSFDMGDAPSRFVAPNNAETANLCGPVGAFCAYYTLYYFGPGVLAACLAGAVSLVVLTRYPTIVAADGSDPRCRGDFDHMVSHLAF